MKEKEFDAIIIGTGQAGPPLATRLAASGLDTAIIEKGKFGGTCVNTGCTPTKTLVASARAAHMARRAADFGVQINGLIQVDMKKVNERKDQLVRLSNEGLEQRLKNTENLTVFEGQARFTGPKTIEVNQQELTADKIFINVGGSAFIPPGFENVDYLTNESMMEVDFVPDHLVIVGGSYIGLEFGQMYRRFGSEVTIIEMAERLLAREDPDVSEELLRILELEGIQVRLNAKCLTGSKHENGIVVEVDCETGDKQVKGSHLLIATGRKPNTGDLGLEAAGIATNKGGFIEVDDQLHTNVDGIWALGDVNGQGAFTHTAYNDFEIVAANLLNNDPRKVSDRILAYALYIDPPLARIGISETQAKELGKNVLMATRSMDRIGRAKEKGETHGFMKILVDDDSELILGATIIGIEADEIIHSLLDIMYARKSYKTIQRAVHIHPTVSELIPTTLGDLKSLLTGHR
jgi:pyruvate/2-oxoglutarate dehydrogenase complex dihydrolipoamide dehydrogenase (E3) component